MKEDDRRLIWADLELEPGRLPEGKTLEDRWHATLDAVAIQGRERFRRLLEMAVERAPVLGEDSVVSRLLALDDEAVKAYLEATLHHHRSLPLIGVNPELKLTLGIDDVYVPPRGQDPPGHLSHRRGLRRAARETEAPKGPAGRIRRGA